MGLQTVDRAVAVLHLLSANGSTGLRLVDVQGKLRLSETHLKHALKHFTSIFDLVEMSRTHNSLGICRGPRRLGR